MTWSGTSGPVSGMLARGTPRGTSCAVPWFAGVRAVRYSRAFARPPAYGVAQAADTAKFTPPLYGQYFYRHNSTN